MWLTGTVQFPRWGSFTMWFNVRFPQMGYSYCHNVINHVISEMGYYHIVTYRVISQIASCSGDGACGDWGWCAERGVGPVGSGDGVPELTGLRYNITEIQHSLQKYDIHHIHLLYSFKYRITPYSCACPNSRAPRMFVEENKFWLWISGVIF